MQALYHRLMPVILVDMPSEQLRQARELAFQLDHSLAAVSAETWLPLRNPIGGGTGNPAWDPATAFRPLPPPPSWGGGGSGRGRAAFGYD